MNRTVRLVFTLLRVAIAVALLFYLGWSGAISLNALRHLSSGWPLVIVALVLLGATVVGNAIRLRMLMQAGRLRLSLPSSLRLTLIGMFFNSCLPGAIGGDVVKIYYATDGNRGRRTEVVTMILLDRVIGMLAMLLWPVLALPLFARFISGQAVLQGLLWAAALTAFAIVAALVVAATAGNSRLLLFVYRRFPLGSYAERVVETIRSFRDAPGKLFGALLLSLLMHTFAIGAALALAAALNPAGFTWLISLLIPLGFLANTLPLTPGGLGVGEAAFTKLFGLIGLTGGAEVLLAWRLLTILIGLLGLVYYLEGRRRFVHEAVAVSA